MTLKRTLTTLVSVIVEEAARNPDFRSRMENALTGAAFDAKRANKSPMDDERKGGRRAPAVLDPIDLARQGERPLRDKLVDLDLERLLDVVAQYGMDPGKLVMKWKDRNRVIDRIVEISLSRATKGDAFRED